MERGNENEDCVKRYGEKKKINQCCFTHRNIKRFYLYGLRIQNDILKSGNKQTKGKKTPKKTQRKEKKIMKTKKKRKKERKPLTQNKDLLNLRQTYTNNTKP